MADYSRRSFVAALGLALAGTTAFAITGCGNTNDTTKTESASEDTAGAASSAETETETETEAEASEYQLVEAGKLTIGCSPDYPPMEYQDGSDIRGFDYGVIKEICDRLGLECNFLSAQNFDTLITQVAAGTKMDVAISAITIDDERKEQVDFSDPYYDSNLAIVVLKDSGYTSRDELEGQPLGAQSGSTGEAWAKENYRDNDYTPFETTLECLASLRTGAVKAVIYDEPVAVNQVSGEYDDCEILDVIATGEQYGIAINKKNTQLTADINKALADMEADGTMDEIKKTWIGEETVAASEQVTASSKAADKDDASSSKD